MIGCCLCTRDAVAALHASHRLLPPVHVPLCTRHLLNDLACLTHGVMYADRIRSRRG